MRHVLCFLLYLNLSAIAKSIPQKTVVVYSGPTSLDRHEAKNGMYHDNMMYFLEHGISCFDDDGVKSKGNDDSETVIVNYAFVLTQEVADYYAGPNGPLTKKIQECDRVDRDNRGHDGRSALIQVITRQDRCYDMESIWIVANSNMLDLYDNILFINCGLVGPRLGPGSPKLIPSSSTTDQNTTQAMVPFSHWSQLYTSRLSDSVRLVGHSINTHFNTFFPHVQSFLYAIHTDTIPLLVSAGAIYDCGLTQEELGSHPEERFALIQRYEVGMSTELLRKGYKIATAFINQFEFGKSLVYDKYSMMGTELDDTVSDIWYEDRIRHLPFKFWETKQIASGFLRLGNMPDKDTFEYHQFDILPWEYFVFFKVSRFVPGDIQSEMKYNVDELEKNGVSIIPNDPRKTSEKSWVVRLRNSFLEIRKIAVVCLVFLGIFAERRRISLVIPGRRLSSLLLRRKSLPTATKMG